MKLLVFYFGAVDGGVWKTENAGTTWRNVTDSTSDVASVGAIAIAPSDPNVLYVGTGEADLREDLTGGSGMYRSTDGARSWRHVGLEDTRHIAAVRVDPHDPNLVYVAAMGHAFGPNPERGVYRSRDGGATWRRVLFLNDSTGAIDLALDPANPRILYAAMWKFQRFPWGFSAGGGRSGLWKSTDGGDHWTELTNHAGLPDGPIGRIGITVSPARPSRLWASVEARDSSGGIFRSDDAGATWSRVNSDQKFMVRPWYFSGITADPANENTVYALNLETWRSIDGGTTFSRVRVPHGDDHTLWVDPTDARRLIEGNDGGATISMDGGDTWSSIDNQPTAQFYHVITDNQFPYRIYGAQQDNTTVSIASRSDHGVITDSDWHDVSGGESSYIAPKPEDPHVVFAGSYMGTVTRFDDRTNQSRDVSIWLNNYDGYAAKDVPYRFQWTFPIVFSPHDSNTLYVAAQYVLRTSDDGENWTRISPDLTRHDSTTLGPVGGPLTRDMTGTEWYGTIFALAESPVKPGELWAGSDDGLIHLSRDGGASWTDVTPPALKPFTRVSIIEPSHFDAGTAYVAANRYQLDDLQPMLFRTTDYGKSWTRIITGIPATAYTRSVREDPVRRGLLFAGTESGVWVSFDDGGHWQSLQLNLPRSSVRDLTIHDADLIVATHGRAFWSLDDIAPLRQIADSIRHAGVFLYTPEPAVRFLGGSGHRVTAGDNPPDGAIVDYWLHEQPHDTVTLAFLDSTGAVVRRFSSASATDTGSTHRDTTADDSSSYAPSDSIVATHAGANRFVWNLRAEPAHKLDNVVVDEGMLDGPQVVPGTYTARLTVGRTTVERRFHVTEDPRVRTSPPDLAAEYALALQVRTAIDSTVISVQRIESIEEQLRQRRAQAKQMPYAERVSAAADTLSAQLDSVRFALAEVESHADEITLNYPIKLYNKLLTLNVMVQGADAAPTPAQRAVYSELSGKVTEQLARLRTIEQVRLAAFDTLIRTLQIPAIVPARQSRTIPR
ncbi:MAG: WD40/YVTN/BNR-like repeat-containing protein [Gemmatimonadaceae bacterium]